MNSAIFGYMIGSPTNDNAQCRSAIASSTRSGNTPSHPANCFRSLYREAIGRFYALIGHHAVVDVLRVVDLPAPRATRRIGVVAPAEQTAVRARQRGRRFHAGRAVQPVERVLVARSVAAEMRFAPATQLDRAVGSHDAVALLLENGAKLASDHFFLFGDVSQIFHVLAEVAFHRFALFELFFFFFSIGQKRRGQQTALSATLSACDAPSWAPIREDYSLEMRRSSELRQKLLLVRLLYSDLRIANAVLKNLHDPNNGEITLDQTKPIEKPCR